MRLFLAALLAAGSLVLVPAMEANAQTKITVKKRAPAPQSYLSVATTGQPQSWNAQRVSVHSSTPLDGVTYGNSTLQSRYPLPGPFDLFARW